MQCPLSHHRQLDELLSSTADALTIVDQYQTWFGQTAFSPFGKIEDLTF